MSYINRGNPNPKNPNAERWPPEAVNVLRAMWADGKSCSQIAAALNGGYTRNAVIGKVHRLGLSRRAGDVVRKALTPGRIAKITPPKPRRELKPKAPLKPVLIVGNNAIFDQPEARAPKEISRARAWDALDGSTPRPWETRKPGECCWPIGAGLSCCEPKADHRYCADHVQMSRRAVVGKRPPTANELARSLRRYVA